jgi:hypothetical protein
MQNDESGTDTGNRDRLSDFTVQSALAVFQSVK